MEPGRPLVVRKVLLGRDPSGEISLIGLKGPELKRRGRGNRDAVRDEPGGDLPDGPRAIDLGTGNLQRDQIPAGCQLQPLLGGLGGLESGDPAQHGNQQANPAMTGRLDQATEHSPYIPEDGRARSIWRRVTSRKRQMSRKPSLLVGMTIKDPTGFVARQRQDFIEDPSGARAASQRIPTAIPFRKVRMNCAVNWTR